LNIVLLSVLAAAALRIADPAATMAAPPPIVSPTNLRRVTPRVRSEFSSLFMEQNAEGKWRDMQESRGNNGRKIIPSAAPSSG
jgi:hypothetical protein